MPKLCMIVRADKGGLGQQTRELWRHLRPEVTIIVRIQNARGSLNEEFFVRPWTTTAAITHGESLVPLINALTDPGDAVLTAETFYCDVSQLHGRRRVLIANPELFKPREESFDTLVIPSLWERERMPKMSVYIPQPTPEPPPERVRIRSEARTFLHLSAPAMLDRNGTQPFIAAAQMMAGEARFIVRGGGGNDVRHDASIEYNTKYVDEWWMNYPDDADCLVIPRRYGGQCLPAQEAASLGLPLIMTDLEPQRMWPCLRTVTRGGRRTMMKGGTFTVHHPVETDIVRAMRQLIADSVLVEKTSRASLEWADALSWAHVGPQWEKLLERETPCEST